MVLLTLIKRSIDKGEPPRRGMSQETWTAYTYRYYGNRDEADKPIYEEEEWTDFESEHNAWEHASDMCNHSERLDRIRIVNPDGDGFVWEKRYIDGRFVWAGLW